MSKALVLSGGGPVGMAWETGVAAGLGEAGIDLSTADFILGTSAGASVGAQLALGRDLAPVVDRYRVRESHQRPDGPLAPTSPSMDAPAATPGRWGTAGPMLRVGQMMSDAVKEGLDPEQARAAVGRYALDAVTMTEQDFVDRFRHLHGEAWPARFVCTAVNAETGEFVVWDGENPADLEQAVAASCAVPGVFPPVTISGARYIDAGGVRSGTSADLAAGHDVVLIITLRDPNAPTDGNPQLERSRQRLQDECMTVVDAGGTVATLAPDAAAAGAMGTNPHDRSVLPAAAAAGLHQGGSAAGRLRELWNYNEQ